MTHNRTIFDRLDPSGWGATAETPKTEKKRAPKTPRLKNGVLNVLHTKESHKLVTLKEKDLTTYKDRKTFIFDDHLWLDIKRGDELDAALAPRTWKILDLMCGDLARQNSLRNNVRINREINIDILGYAKMLGYNVDTKKGREVGKREILQHLQIINALKIYQEIYLEKGKTKEDEVKITDRASRIVEGRTAKEVCLTISQTYIETQLMLGHILPLPPALFAIDDKHPFAYALGRALCYYNNVPANVKQDREGFISVSSLLTYCRDIPQLEGLRTRDWRNRIIRPFANALNVLQRGGVIRHWTIMDDKREPLGKGMLDDCTLEQFYSYFVDFSLVHQKPRDERLIEIEEKEKERKRKQRGKARKPRGKAKMKKAA